MDEDDGMVKFNVLVLGFSVVADTPGFVEQAQALESSRFRFAKVGIGGVRLSTFRYMLPLLLEQNPCDLLILEIGTPGLRWNDADQAREYRELVTEVTTNLQSTGQAIALWDLPRINAATGPDGIYDSHAALCLAGNIPYLRTPFKPKMLRDDVHCSVEGHAFYATELVRFVNQIVEVSSVSRQKGMRGNTTTQSKWQAIPVAPLWPSSAVIVERLTRSGLDIDMFALTSEASVTLSVPDPWQIMGVSYLIGPRSGTLEISSPDRTERQRIGVYDKFCYYRHLGLKLFSPPRGATVTLTQLEHKLDTDLLKGTTDNGPRCGFIGHLLVRCNEGLE
jgi:hypothetical protein